MLTLLLMLLLLEKLPACAVDGSRSNRSGLMYVWHAMRCDVKQLSSQTFCKSQQNPAGGENNTFWNIQFSANVYKRFGLNSYSNATQGRFITSCYKDRLSTYQSQAIDKIRYYPIPSS